MVFRWPVKRSWAPKGLLIFLDRLCYEALIRKTVIGVLADDDMVEDLDHEKLGRPDKLSRQFSVLRRWRRIAGRVVVNENQGCRLVFEGQGHDLPRVNGAAREGALENIVIGEELIFPVEE